MLAWVRGYYTFTEPYLSLHHQAPLLPHFADKGINIQRLLHLHPLHHAIQYNECARTPNTSAAVHDKGRAVVVREVLSHTLDKLDEAGLVCWHAMVWPGREVEVSDRDGL